MGDSSNNIRGNEIEAEIRHNWGVDGGRGWKGDVKLMLLDITKAKKAGWRPKLSSKQAVRKATEDLLGSDSGVKTKQCT